MDSHNTLLFTTLLVMHIIGGSASLLAGVLASFSEKGRLFHRTVGKVYVIAMAVVFVTAIAMAVLHPNLFLAAVGVFSFYNAWSGFMAMQRSLPMCWKCFCLPAKPVSSDRPMGSAG